MSTRCTPDMTRQRVEGLLPAVILAEFFFVFEDRKSGDCFWKQAKWSWVWNVSKSAQPEGRSKGGGVFVFLLTSAERKSASSVSIQQNKIIDGHLQLCLGWESSGFSGHHTTSLWQVLQWKWTPYPAPTQLPNQRLSEIIKKKKLPLLESSSLHISTYSIAQIMHQQ